MLETIHCSTILPASPEQIYKDWLSSEGHSAFTGSPAEVDPEVGGHFSAWDGYILGTNIELEPFQRILQSWRTSEFPDDSPDSHLEILLEAVEGGTRITFNHWDIPAGQGDSYAQGWQDFYFTPMQAYFSSL